MTIPRLASAHSVLLVIDVQDKLLAKMQMAAPLVRNVGFLLDVAALLAVPARATEQYPKGLGPTTPELARRLPSDPPAKTAFSAFGASGFSNDLRTLGRMNAVLTGMETHVCVAQTAFDLLEAGYVVFVPLDAVASRFTIDYETALRPHLDRHGPCARTCGVRSGCT